MVTTKQKSWTETLNKKGGNGANHREKPQIYKKWTETEEKEAMERQNNQKVNDKMTVVNLYT